MSTLEQPDLSQFAASTGESLDELSRQSPLLVVFLRHQGCAFCREVLAELAQRRPQIEARGVRIVLVHLIPDDNAAEMFFARWRLHDVPRISDPQQQVYRAFGLARGTLWQVLGLGVWWPGVKAILRGHLPGKPQGDIFQLPGAFVVHQGKIVQAFRAATSAEKADLLEMSVCACGDCQTSNGR
jgi:peroxiredoxin